MDKELEKKAAEIKAEKEYPGAAIDAADHDKVDESLVKERTCTLDSNPRNNDL